jgi:hypothetical protein
MGRTNLHRRLGGSVDEWVHTGRSVGRLVSIAWARTRFRSRGCELHGNGGSKFLGFGAFGGFFGCEMTMLAGDWEQSSLEIGRALHADRSVSQIIDQRVRREGARKVAGTERTARISQVEMIGGGFFVRSFDFSCVLSSGHVGRGFVSHVSFPLLLGERKRAREIRNDVRHACLTLQSYQISTRWVVALSFGWRRWMVDGGWWRGLLLLVSLTCGMHVESWYPHGQTVLYITLQCFARCVSV